MRMEWGLHFFMLDPKRVWLGTPAPMDAGAPTKTRLESRVCGYFETPKPRLCYNAAP